MKISRRETILSSVALAVVLGGMTGYIVHGKINTHKTRKIEMEQIRQQIRLDERRIRMQKEWMVNLNNLQKYLHVFDIRKKSLSPELMKTIKDISSRHGLNITRSQPYEEKPTDDLFELGINCTWEGKLEALVGFLAELQQQGVRYDVRTLNVTPVGKNTGRLKGNMVIHCAYTKKMMLEKTEVAEK